MVADGCGRRPPHPSTAYLQRAWEDYKNVYITTDGRVIDPDRGGGDTTSEGQGYALLRALRDGALFTKYSTDGTPLERVESLSFYGAALPFLLHHAPVSAQAIRANQLSESSLDSLLTKRNRYFDANWVWFGVAAADGFIEARTPAVDVVPVR